MPVDLSTAAAAGPVRGRPRRAVRLPAALVPALVLTAITVGCSSGDDATATSGAPTGATATQPGALPPAITAAGGTFPTLPPAATVDVGVDGPTLLRDGLAALGSGYHFSIVATVDGAVALQADGDRVGTGLRQTVTSQGTTVDYLVLPEGTWYAQDGTWAELAEPAPVTDPVAALGAPALVQVAAADGDAVTVVATYPAEALGLPAGTQVPVTIELVAGALTTFTYTSADGTASSRTEISALTDTAPITAPVTAPA